ncbi:MAG: hypothetical protein FJZ01_16355 [Candidatus Sericytochromatia bacterium]|nr:hypothetical protein [Candidatus Tanganyikabacteria bacterium]
MRSRAGRTARFAALALSAGLVGACSLMKTPTASVGTALTGDSDTLKLAPAQDAGTVSAAKTAVTDFKKLNSTENFTMPIGNNFTMPIGNNFTMPIGNNLIGNVGAGYRIATTVTGKTLLGFAPVPSGSDFATTSAVTSLPASGSSPQTGTIKSGDRKYDATIELAWWNDACGSAGQSACEGYKDKITYNTLTIPVGGEDRQVKGSAEIRISGPSTIGNWKTTDAAKYGGLLLLGINANPTTMSRRQEVYSLKLKSDLPVADIQVDQTQFRAFAITVPKNNSQDARNVDIQVPQVVGVSGSLVSPAGSAMGINLKATADYDKKLFKLFGWLKTCTSSTCAATDAASATGASDEIYEDYTLDFENALATLKFSKPATGAANGWRLTLRYDYGVALVLGKPGGSLTGDMWLIDSAGKAVEGGKLADIEADSSGNPVIKYLDGTSETWRIN